MQSHGKIQKLIVLFILNIIVLVLAVVLSNFTYGQELQTLHNQTLYEITNEIKQRPTQVAHIAVGETPGPMLNVEGARRI
jgi:hypothetical protein